MRCRILLGLALAAAPAAARDADAADWRQAIRGDDRTRLNGLRPAWTQARAQVAGRGGTLEALGSLVVPETATTAGDWPTAGAYRCRVVKIGANDPTMPAVADMPPIACRVDVVDGHIGFSADAGAQRFGGRFYPDGARMVFLGAMTLRGDMSPFAYGMDPDRNQVGVLERIGAARWRLALPWPRWQSTLVLVEIVPAG